MNYYQSCIRALIEDLERQFGATAAFAVTAHLARAYDAAADVQEPDQRSEEEPHEA
jgi:hypothetical protein